MSTIGDELRTLVSRWKNEAQQACVYPEEAATLEACAAELEAIAKRHNV